MAIIKAFRGIRPLPEHASSVASRPYDVLNSAEARVEAEGNPLSFLNVVKPEITLPEDLSQYDPQVYEAGKAYFEKMQADGVMNRDGKPSLYVYELIWRGQAQSGLVALASIEDYFNDVIKKHELTRPVKEEDRKTHVRVSSMNAEPVFFAYPAVDEMDALVSEVQQGTPVYDFEAVDDVRHRLWVVDDEPTVDKMIELFATKVPATYVADGHHRTAAAALVGQDLKNANPNHTGEEPYNYFLAVHFPDNQLRIIDYNRVVKDLNGLSSEEFLQKLESGFEVEKREEAYSPEALHTMGLYLDNQWYKLTAKEGTYDDTDPIKALDVTILTDQVLSPLLGIEDLRRDPRIEFVGGIRGLGELERRVHNGEMKAAFSLYPVSMDQLITIADAGEIMPPKVTWFEPKLRSGLVVNHFGEW